MKNLWIVKSSPDWADYRPKSRWEVESYHETEQGAEQARDACVLIPAKTQRLTIYAIVEEELKP